MTSKEKSQELFDKNFEVTNNYYQAKQCALISVDEMLTWFKAHSYSNKNYDAFVFYNEVKQKIEKL